MDELIHQRNHIPLVKRENKESRRATREAVKDRLTNGYGVAIFPEGTTHKGPDLLPYHKGIFYTCAENGCPIVPAAIEYENPEIAWVGKEMFIPHAFRHFGARKINVHVSFGPSMSKPPETERSNNSPFSLCRICH